LTGITETALSDFCNDRCIPILVKPVEKNRLLEALVKAHG